MSDSSRNLVNAWRKKTGQETLTENVSPKPVQQIRPENINLNVSKQEALKMLENAYNLIFKAYQILNKE